MRVGRRRQAHSHQTLYKLLSLLLHYPSEDLLAERPVILATVADLPASPQQAAIARFAAYWADASPGELAQTYVETFDLRKQSSLYLTYYLHGDTRGRGMALARLKHLYRAGGLVPEGRELPDYLPMMLEFAAFAPPGYGELVLNEYRAALALIQEDLRARASPYAELFDALCACLPVLTPLDREQVRRLIAEGPPRETVGLEPYAPPDVMPVTR